MPTYSYACTACGHAFDIRQSFTDDALTVCPECEGRLRKVLGNVGVVFKGSGFYRNDSRADGKTRGTSSGKTPASTSSSTSGTGSSSAPAASSSPSSTSPTSSAASSSTPSSGAA